MKDFFPKSGTNRDFLVILEQCFWFVQIFFNFWLDIPQFNLYFLKKMCSLEPVRIMNRLPR
jgi:hypothetical protein